MFSRKRATSNPPQKQAASTNIAALQGATRAFVKPSASNGGLSSAAAAAALRTHPSAPIQVGNVQTKRMIRRGSTSSNGSAAPSVGQPRATLQRKNSSGSMSERSFRAQSPSQGSSYGPSNGLSMYAPPVPAIPKNLQDSSRRRSSSIDPTMRVGSPLQNGRGVGVDRGAGSTYSPVNRTMSLTAAQEREDNRRSINFSRPMSPASARDSPVAQKGHSGWFTEPLTSDNTTLREDLDQVNPYTLPTDLETDAQRVQNAADAPVAKKKHAAAVEATYLSKGSMQAKPRGTAIQNRAANSASPSVSSPISQNTSATSSKGASPTSPITSKPPKAATPVSAVPQKSHLANDIQRTASVSPARSARFLDAGLEVGEGVKHQPPPRSISPAKSALKRSATSPNRTGSPVARFSSAISEASDTVSDDGKGSASKKKKNVRVSFDEPALEGKDSPPTSPTRGLNASRWSGQTAVEEDLDEIMKPRPALPSFGSLRGRKSRDEAEVPEKVTETVTSSMTNSVSTIGEPLEGSKDHNVGRIVAQDFAKKGGGLEPFPPEVTSVEGSGYPSDSETSSINNDGVPATVARPPTPPKSDHIAGTDTEATFSADAPAIAVQPPTPKVEEDQDDLFSVPGSWSDFEEDREENMPTKRNAEKVPSSAERPEQKVISTDPSIPKPAPVASKDIVASQSQISQGTDYDALPRRANDDDAGLHTLEEESESDGGSIYSDAEEELSDGGGFASLDAMVESPVVLTPQRQPKLAVDTSPLSNKAISTAPASSPISPKVANVDQASQASRVAKTAETRPESPSEDWNQAKQYWSGLTVERRKEVEREEALRAAQETALSSPTTAEPKPKKKKKIVQAESPVGQAFSPVEPARQQRPAKQAQQPTKPALKQTMRGAQQPASQAQPAAVQPRSSMRKSMRGPAPRPEPAQAPMRQTMRSEQPTLRTSMRQGGLSASRYSDTEDDRQPRNTMRSGGLEIAPLPTVPPPRTRNKSASGLNASKHVARPVQARSLSLDDDDSDASQSSFQRNRSKRAGGGMSMRRTMRGAPQATANMPPAPKQRPASMIGTSLRPTSPDFTSRSSRLSVRSLSPTGSLFRRPFRSGSVDAQAPTLRDKERPSSKGSIFSFGGKKESKKARPMSASMAVPRMSSANRFQSRFVDSSDEEDADVRPSYSSRFSSRFNDSDEEDVPPVPPMPKGLPQLRGIPRKPGQDSRDSTDLEDEESDRERTRPPPTKGTQGTALTSGSLRDSRHARIADDVPEPSSSPVVKKKRGFFGLGRSKKVPREQGQLPALQRPSTPPTREATGSPIGQSPRSPVSPSGKLQRRNTSQRVLSDSWPLPAPPKIGQEQRPNSSDGPLRGPSTRRPPLGDRITSTGTTATAPMVQSDGRAVVSGRTGKKKRFQGLRKAFRLND